MRQKRRTNDWLKGNNFGAKPVLDLHTGVLWNSVDEMAASTGEKQNTVNKRVNRNKEGRYLRMTRKQAQTLNKGKVNELSILRIY